MALNVVCLVGGVGGAKLAHGLAQILSPGELSVIVNTADDLWYYGLRVCPDLDTVTYTLAGLIDPVNGWGLAGDTRHNLSALGRYGEDTWFGVGDQDLATHLIRSERLRKGERLTTIMLDLARRLGLEQQVLPMTDAEVATRVMTVEQGELDFQAYFVRERWQPTVQALRLAGIEDARLSVEVEQALAAADVILLGPSNPWLSLLPILNVPGMREALNARDVPKVALTPIVQGESIKGPAGKLMRELGYEASAASIAAVYDGVINGFVYDNRDTALHLQGVRSVGLDTIMRTDGDRASLAQQILDWTLDTVVQS